MAKKSDIHPAFDISRSNAELVGSIAEAGDKKLEQATKASDALAFFQERIWEFEDAVERAFDEWLEYDETHEDEIEALQDTLSEMENKEERKKIESRLNEIAEKANLLHAKYEAIKKEVAELKERGASLEKAEKQTGTEAMEYLQHLQALLQLSPLTKPIEE